MGDLRLYNALLADLNKATSAWLSDPSTVESANVYKAKILLTAGWTKRPKAAFSIQQPPSEAVPAAQEQELLNAPYVSTEALEDIIARAYEDGCSDTHQEIHRNPDRASERHPEFGEAASDYAYEVISRLRTPGGE